MSKHKSWTGWAVAQADGKFCERSIVRVFESRYGAKVWAKNWFGGTGTKLVRVRITVVGKKRRGAKK